MTKNHEVSFQGDLEYERQTHQTLCWLVKKADSFLGMLTLPNTLLPVITVCLIVYNLVSYPALSAYLLPLIMEVFWLLTSAGIFTLTCVIGGYLNHHVSF